MTTYTPAPRFRRLATAGAAGVLWALTWWWAGAGALAAYRGEAWSVAADTLEQRLQQDGWEAPDDQFVDLLTAAQYAAETEPENVRHGYFLNLYRWRSISRVRDPETGELLLHPDVLPFVEQIADELTTVRRLCPTYGPPYGLEGELRLLVLKQAEGERLIRDAARLAPYHSATCLVAGHLAAQQGDLEQAVELLNRSVELEPNRFAQVARIYVEQLQRPDLAESLAGNEYGRLILLAELLTSASEEHPEYAARAESLKTLALERLEDRAERGEASANELVRLAEVKLRKEDHRSAIQLYRRALAANYDQVAWRMALARTLVVVGDYKQAEREARICLRLRPGYEPANNLILEVSVLPDAKSGE